MISRLARIATADIREAYDDDGNLLPIKEIPDHLAAAIDGLDIEDGEYGRKVKLRLSPRQKALENLARHLKLLTDRVEHSADSSLAEALAAAQKRAGGGDA